MQFKATACYFRRLPEAPPKLLLYMRITALVLLATAMQVSANGFGQSISLSKRKISLERLFTEVNRQTGFNFIYNDALLKKTRPFSIHVSNLSLRETLELVLNKHGLSYKIVDKTIILRPAGIVNQPTEEKDPFELVAVPVKGTVTDAAGVPLEGVTILQKGKSSGTTTDENGNFSLEVDENSTIEISYVGYEKQSIKVGKINSFNITLEKLPNDLGEVIVVGYGTTTRAKNVTSVTTIKSDKIQNLGATSVGEALAGRVPGLIVTASGGGIGKRPAVSIRGGGTPVFVIDDIISSEFQFQTLNINDIENISFLKDGPATAIYGVAAGNGVVLVTTKRGSKGKTSVNYNFGQDLSQPTYLPRKISSFELASLINKVDENEGNVGRYTPEDVQKYRDQSDPLNFPNNDWQELVLKNFAPTSRHNLSINGGSKQLQYYASLGYQNQGTLYQFNTNWMKRYNYRLSVTSEFEKIGLKATVAIYGGNEIRRDNQSAYGSGYFAVWSHIQNASPMERAFADLERTKYANKGDHPIVETDPRSGYNRDEDRDNNANVILNWTVPGVKGLSFRANGNFRQSQYNGRSWNATAPQYAIGSDIPTVANAPNLQNRASTGYNYVLQGFGEYSRTFGDHSISGLFGYEEAYSYNEGFSAGRNSYVFGIDQLFAGPQATATNTGSAREEVRNAWLGRIGYDFKEKYFLEGSFRNDGSDLFPAGKRRGFFPGAAIGWVISKENFMEKLDNLNILNYLKYRISYGSVGQIQRNGDGSPTIGYFAYIPGYSQGSGYVVNGVLQPTLNPPSIPSPDISWFDQRSFNTGFDFATLNNRLSGTFDYFYLRTTGYLASPSGQGYTDPLGTALPTRRSNGAFRRAGFDFSMKYNNSIGKLQYNIGANFTKFDQLWEINPNEDSATLKNPYTTSYHQLGFLQTAYRSTGLYQTSADIINNPRRRSSNLAPGDIIYQDSNGDGKIDGEDFRRIGKNGFPRTNFGFTADLKYGGWFMNMLWQGSGKRSIYLGDVIQSNYSTSIRYDFQTEDRWEAGKGNNADVQFPRMVSGSGVNGGHNAVTSDWWIINAGYVRLKALQIGYDFKKLLVNRFDFVQDFRVTLSGTNLLTFSEIKKYGLDPETGSNNNYDYPSQRVYSLNVNIGF
ncbi:SusC/RagA family TonB-linked outer membrane protein [Flavihumibacter sp. UBA7668]|uniref:SusC/RagA family TonB-linked outer membrane protein n=1 Tax=Flavihumibacter sp. UBA7668 TaxID=1946542 RepID=UPI0025BDB1B5|nr:SusC/RagA family TonB-linked outer membrane protein [Flavihumibacter sp. UBA7668]